MDSQYYVYILTNRKNGTLYVGITSDLVKRVYEHQQKLVPGFTQKYCLDKLVYFDVTANSAAAILQEKRLKKWKIQLIEQKNPEWKDLFPVISGAQNVDPGSPGAKPARPG